MMMIMMMMTLMISEGHYGSSQAKATSQTFKAPHNTKPGDIIIFINHDHHNPHHHHQNVNSYSHLDTLCINTLISANNGVVGRVQMPSSPSSPSSSSSSSSSYSHHPHHCHYHHHHHQHQRSANRRTSHYNQPNHNRPHQAKRQQL